MAKSNEIKKFKSQLEVFNKYDFTKFYKTGFGEKSLIELKKDLEILVQRFNKTLDHAEDLSTNVIVEAQSDLSSLAQLIQRVEKFNDQDFMTHRPTTISQFIGILDKVQDWYYKVLAVSQSIPNTEIENQKIQELESKLQELLAQMSKKEEELESVLQKSRTDADLLNEKLKEPLSQAEILSRQSYFEEQASIHKKRSKNWLIAIVISVIVFCFSLWFLIKGFCFESCCFQRLADLEFNNCKNCIEAILYLEIFKASIFRVFVLGVLTYLISLSVKNYYAEMHNYVVNSHRANSLLAAFSLLDRAQTPEGNDRIMAEAVNAIFSHQPSGFTGKHAQPQNPVSASSILSRQMK